MTTWERFWGVSRVYLAKYTGLFNRKGKNTKQKQQRNIEYTVPESLQFPELASLTIRDHQTKTLSATYTRTFHNLLVLLQSLYNRFFPCPVTSWSDECITSISRRPH